MTKQEIENRIEAIKAQLDNTDYLVQSKVEANLDIVDMDSRYDDMLDECHGEVKLGYLTFSPSRVLAELEPATYRCGFSDFVAAEESNKRIQEVNGNYYDYDEVEEIRDSITSDLESELENRESELANLHCGNR